MKRVSARFLTADDLPADMPFVLACLRELNARLDAHMLAEYLRSALGSDDTRIAVFEDEDGPVGVLTLGRFQMPRYVGVGYEIQEIVVAQHARSRGVGAAMVAWTLDQCARDPLTRKVVVRTNGEQAKRFYLRYFDQSDLATFQKLIHRV